MKTTIASLTFILFFSCMYSQERPEMDSKMKVYANKIDSIMLSEKSKMNRELDDIDKNFRDNKITSEEKQKQRTEIASKYEQSINEKIDTQKDALQDVTKEIVKNSVFYPHDTLKTKKDPNNQVSIGLNGLWMKLSQENKKTPKDYLRTIDLSVSFVSANLTSKDEPFRFFSKDSDVRNTVYNSTNFALRYENQVGGFESPVFYRFGLGVRSDNFVPKYGKVFSQEQNVLKTDDFTKGNLRKTNFANTYLFIPLDIRFVLNPKYTTYDGIRYLDNKKSQINIVAGVYGGLKVGSVIYNKYSNDYSKRIVERERVMHGVNDFVFGGKLGVGIGGFNIYIQKDFTPAFNNNADLKKKYGLQIGVELANINF
ncbi:hypothetical protein [Chryseobacterium chendengshani]|uniref:hypothetical protein n=1 Tax=Chryseobacterium sp. LJ756 TaxID=2864113 RepID=UPI001C63C3D9|nr:hypothetical protein [Chryseobacterium sp. LJ756]MBW7674627.1 hypothetical protein [Chryseobacterium sp. LJ756]